MPAPQQSFMANKLLALLPQADYDRIAVDLELIDLPRGMPLVEVDVPIEHVYFLTSGIGSVVAVTPEGHKAEAGIFGFEGLIPTNAIAGSNVSPYSIGMQLGGDGYRMDYGAFRGWMDSNRNFAAMATRWSEAFAIQLVYTAVSNAVHDVNERLARWLLMCHDRVPGQELPLTHEYISYMLAVRRPSVTTALHVLEGNGFIKSERSLITIRNRPALEEFAHDAYGRPEQEYRRLMKDLF